MADFGLTEDGFKRKTYTDIQNGMEAKARELFGDDINLSERSPLGMFLKIMAWEGAEIWELAEEVYNSAYIDTAEGASQDNASKYVAIRRKVAQKARGTITIKGTAGTIVPRGFRVSTDVTAILFGTTEQAQVPGAEEVDVSIAALEPGEKGNVPAGTINKIVNPMAGVDEVANMEETQDGTDTEKDHEFRERYYRTVSRGGGATRTAVESALIDMAEVVDALVIENDTTEFMDDIPPKSLFSLVEGGANTNIAETILTYKAGGIRAFGDIELTIKDSRGIGHLIGFSRPSKKEIYVMLDIIKDDGYPGDDAVKKAVIVYIGGIDGEGTLHKGLRLGEDVIISRITSGVMLLGGIKDIKVKIGLDNVNWQTTNIQNGIREIAVADCSRVAINYV